MKTNKTTIRQAIENTNVLLDTVYQCALKNPTDTRDKNIIDWESWGNSLELNNILKLIFGIDKYYIRTDYKTRTVTIENKLILKFKMKKVKYSRPCRWGGNSKEDDEQLSVISIELIQGEEYLDLTIEEFKVRVNKEKEINKTNEEQQVQDDFNSFINLCESKGISVKDFLEIQREYKNSSYTVKNKIDAM